MRNPLSGLFDVYLYIFSLLGRVAFGKKHILITKRGKPMARLVPADEPDLHLSKVKGWLEGDDPFFDVIDRIIRDRTKQVPRVLKRNYNR